MHSPIYTALLITIALVPLPLASNRPVFWGIVASTTGVLLIAWSFSAIMSGKGAPVSIRKIWPSALLAAIVAFWALIQTLPLSIESYTHPIWNEASILLPDFQTTNSISLDAYKTGTALMRLITYFGIFWLFLQYARSAKRARQIFWVITLAGFAYSLYGLAVYFSGSHSILWLEKWAYRGDLTSVFVNRNSFATYAGLTLLCPAAMLVEFLFRDINTTVSRNSKIRTMLEHLTEKGWIFIVIAFVITTALVLTHSRAGLISTLLGLVTLAITFGLSSTISLKRSVYGAIIIVGIMVAVYYISGEMTSKRMADVSASYQASRSHLNDQSLKAIAVEPWLGYGYGTYENSAGMFKNEEFHLYARAAHNTYFENMLELGVPMAIALFISIALLGAICLRGALNRKKDVIYPCVGVSATVIIGAHSMVDFSMQIPAVAITYSALMGTACAQSWSSLE